MKRKKYSNNNTNYTLPEPKVPKSPMGWGGASNLPDRPIVMQFGKKHDYRSGIVNGYNCGVEEVSQIPENKK